MNIKLLNYKALCLGLIFFCSCKKDNQPLTTVEGIVSNRVTSELVKNIPIEIIECDGWPQKCLTTLQTVYTDAKGHYKTTFKWENGKGYKVAVGVNNTVANSPYPYYFSLSKNVSNTVNFSQFPLKVLQLHFKILRHDKNWLQLGVQACDGLGYFAHDFYFGPNPVNNFDTTYQIQIEAGRQYRAHVGLSDKTAPYTYQNNEFIYKFFPVDNIDTTKIDFIVQ